MQEVSNTARGTLFEFKICFFSSGLQQNMVLGGDRR